MEKVLIVFMGDYNFDARSINMAETLANNNYNVSVLHSTSKENILSNNAISLINISLNCVGKMKYFEWFVKIKKILKNKSYNLIIAGDLYSLPVVFYAKTAKVIYDCRDLFVNLSALNYRPFTRLFWSCVEKYAFKKVCCVLCTASTDINYLKKQYVCSPHMKYNLIYNFPKIYNDPQKNYLKKRLKIKKNAKILLYQGVLQSGRGILQLINIVKKSHNIVGVVVGDGPFKKKYIEVAKNEIYNKKMFFLNSFPYKKLFSATSSADVGLVLIEPNSLNNKFALPNKLFEYAAVGVPSLACNSPNIKEFSNKYSLGSIVSMDDVLEQKRELKNLFSLTDLDKKELIKRAKHSLSWDSQEKKFLTVIKNV